MEEGRSTTDNLSGVLASPLDVESKERQRQSEIIDVARAAAALWNDFLDREGSFADDHSTL
jgi:hypothetical protein